MYAPDVTVASHDSPLRRCGKGPAAGPSGGNRTHSPMVPNHVLYHLATPGR